jgi:DnaJ domain
MEIEEACKILKIKDIYDVSEIKKKYKQESRKYHPDRGGDSKQFILIKEAYDVLIENSKKPKRTLMDDIDSNLLRYYLYYIKDYPIFHIPIIEKYINRPIHEHLSQYKKYEINPSLSHLLKKEIYFMNEHGIYIPLWHHQLIFYNKIKITIVPSLPENITIDDNNDILIHNPNIIENCIIIDGISFLMKEEEYKNKCLVGRGIPRIKNNIYDVSELGNIMFYD